jgi:hypothetical protein
MWGKSLEVIVAALKGMGGGYFVLRDDDDAQYVVMPVQEFEKLSAKPADEVQLSLPSASARTSSPAPARRPAETAVSSAASAAAAEVDADEVLERINREIALYQESQQEEAAELLGAAGDEAAASEAGKRVRFEPLRGDLPPELQE